MGKETDINVNFWIVVLTAWLGSNNSISFISSSLVSTPSSARPGRHAPVHKHQCCALAQIFVGRFIQLLPLLLKKNNTQAHLSSLVPLGGKKWMASHWLSCEQEKNAARIFSNISSCLRSMLVAATSDAWSFFTKLLQTFRPIFKVYCTVLTAVWHEMCHALIKSKVHTVTGELS